MAQSYESGQPGGYQSPQGGQGAGQGYSGAGYPQQGYAPQGYGGGYPGQQGYGAPRSSPLHNGKVIGATLAIVGLILAVLGLIGFIVALTIDYGVGRGSYKFYQALLELILGFGLGGLCLGLGSHLSRRASQSS